jgi:hypothetical protein
MVIISWAGFSIIRQRAIAAGACPGRFLAALPHSTRGFHVRDSAMVASKLAPRAAKRPVLARPIAIAISIQESSKQSG